MNEKWLWASCSIIIGALLCIYGNTAFTAVGVIFGAAIIICGICLFINYVRYRENLAICVLLFFAGVLTIILCAAFKPAAFFLGGIIFLAAAVAIFLYVYSVKKQLIILQAVFCVCLALSGIILIVSPGFADFFSQVIGAGLIAFGGAFIILW